MVACSEVDARVEGKRLAFISASDSIVACNTYTDRLYSLRPATHFV